MRDGPNYLRVLALFARNSLVRDMTFRANFLVEMASSLAWMAMNLAFYILVFEYTPMLGVGTGWGKHEFFVFLATTYVVNGLVQGLFMTNADEFSEMIRTGSLDCALLKPIDTQFLVSLQRIEWASVANLAFGAILLVYALAQLGHVPSPLQAALYLVYVACGVTILYGLMIALAASSVWLGRNQTLYDFWFYITNFARYPREIYRGTFGSPLRWFFTFIIPVLVVVNVPARFLAGPLAPSRADEWLLPLFTLVAAVVSLAGSRWLFHRALSSYRSASS
jgi:ABC-2 type transport system permease protein